MECVADHVDALLRNAVTAVQRTRGKYSARSKQGCRNVRVRVCEMKRRIWRVVADHHAGVDTGFRKRGWGGGGGLVNC